MGRNATIVSAAVVLAAAAVLTACSGDDSDADGTNGDGLRPISLAHDGSSSAAAVAMGIEQGFFEEAGFDAEQTFAGQPPATIAAVQSGQIDAASVPIIPAISAMSRDIPLLPFAPNSGYPEGAEEGSEYDTFGIYVSEGSDITEPIDLEGRSVGVPARSAIFEVFVADAVVRAGGDASTIEWVVLDFASQVSAILDGRVDAIGVPSPFTLQAEEGGATLLWSPGIAFYGSGYTSAWFASPDLAEDEEALCALNEAILRSNEYANANRDEAMAEASEITGIDLEVLESDGRFNYFLEEWDTGVLEPTETRLVELGFVTDPAGAADLAFDTGGC